MKTKIKKNKKSTTSTATDRMAAARAARAKGVKRSPKAKGDGMPDPKKMKELHLKYKNDVGAKLLTTSKVVGYFKSVGQGIRVSKEDVLAAISDEMYSTMFRAMLRAMRNNRKTVRSFDIR